MKADAFYLETSCTGKRQFSVTLTCENFDELRELNLARERTPMMVEFVRWSADGEPCFTFIFIDPKQWEEPHEQMATGSDNDQEQGSFHKDA